MPPSQASIPISSEGLKVAQPLCTADLSAAIADVIEQPELRRSRWGILVQTLAPKLAITNPKTLYSLRGEQYFLPASNAKLLTTAAALHQLGPDFQFETPVYAQGQGPTLEELRVIGQGDPSLTTPQLTAIAQSLRAQGVQQIDFLVAQAGDRTPSPINPTWEWEDLFTYYAVGANRLMLNGNTVTLTLTPQAEGEGVSVSWSDRLAAQQWQLDNQVRTAPEGTPYDVTLQGKFGTQQLFLSGQLTEDAEPDPWGLSIPDPDQYFLDTLQQELGNQGIKVKQATVIYESALPPQQPIQTLVSRPLSFLIAEVNQDSNNLYAEALRNHLLQTSSGENSEPEDAIVLILKDLGIDPNSYHLADGSGLSRHHLVSPAALVATLQAMAQHPNADIYRDSLALAGETGTLQRRFQDTAIAGKLWGKTGTLTGVSALSGYLSTAAGETLVFSILVNQSDLPSSQLRRAIDQIVLHLYQLQECAAFSGNGKRNIGSIFNFGVSDPLQTPQKTIRSYEGAA